MSNDSTQKRPRSVRALDVLPETLVAEIQRYVEGTYLYVPSHRSWGLVGSVAEVLRLRADGVSIAETARRVGVSARRVCQIQKRARERAASYVPSSSRSSV